jgi:hypothetical protein
MERKRISDQVRKIRANIQLFQEVLRSGKSDPKARLPEHNYVEKLKIQMELTENLMVSFKSDQRDVFEELVSQEKLLTRDVSAYALRLQAPTTTPTTAPTTPSKKPAMQAKEKQDKLAEGGKERDIVKEVEEYDKFVLRRGPLGGWETYDHGVFLKIRRRQGRDPSFIDAVVAALPGRTAPEVIEHEQWYDELEYLAAARRDAIAQWRADKQEREERDAAAVAPLDRPPQGPEAGPGPDHDRDRERDEAKRAQQRDVVAQWRASRAAAAALEQQEQQQQLVEADSRRAAAAAAEKRALKEQVAAFREQRRLAAAAAPAPQEPPRVLVRAEDLAARRAADEVRVAQRREAARMAEAEAALKAERLARLKAKVCRMSVSIHFLCSDRMHV